MKKLWLALLILTIPIASPGQEMASRNKRPGESAGYASRDATVLSMMGWGVGLAAGIAALCALVHNEKGSSSHTH